MDKLYLENRTNLIRNVFKDNSELEYLGRYGNGELFLADNFEIIFLNLLIDNFNEDKLLEFVKIAEDLYNEFSMGIKIYLAATGNVEVTVDECEIKSFADFTIKLAKTDIDVCSNILTMIKAKMVESELSKADIEILSMLPFMCQENERDYYRKEYFKIMAEI